MENAEASTRLLAMTTLRNILGTKTLSEMLSDRDHISQEMQVNISIYCINLQKILLEIIG